MPKEKLDKPCFKFFSPKGCTLKNCRYSHVYKHDDTILFKVLSEIEKGDLTVAQINVEKALHTIGACWKIHEATMWVAYSQRKWTDAKHYSRLVLHAKNKVRPSTIIMAHFVLGVSLFCLSQRFGNREEEAIKELSKYVDMSKTFDTQDKDWKVSQPDAEGSDVALPDQVRSVECERKAHLCRAQLRFKEGLTKDAFADIEVARSFLDDADTRGMFASLAFALQPEDELFTDKWSMCLRACKDLWSADAKAETLRWVRYFAMMPRGVSCQQDVNNFLEELSDLLTETNNSDELFNVLLTRVELLTKQRDMEQAFTLAQQTIYLNTKSDVAHFRLARLYYYARAIDPCAKALAKAEKLWLEDTKRNPQGEKFLAHERLRSALEIAAEEQRILGADAARDKLRREQEYKEAARIAAEKQRVAEEKAQKDRLAEEARLHRKELAEAKRKKEQKLEADRVAREAKILEDEIARAEAKVRQQKTSKDLESREQADALAAKLNNLLVQVQAAESTLSSIEVDETLLYEKDAVQILPYLLSDKREVSSLSARMLDLYPLLRPRDLDSAERMFSRPEVEDFPRYMAVLFNIRKCGNALCTGKELPENPCLTSVLNDHLEEFFPYPDRYFSINCFHSKELRLCTDSCVLRCQGTNVDGGKRTSCRNFAVFSSLQGIVDIFNDNINTVSDKRLVRELLRHFKQEKDELLASLDKLQELDKMLFERDNKHLSAPTPKRADIPVEIEELQRLVDDDKNLHVLLNTLEKRLMLKLNKFTLAQDMMRGYIYPFATFISFSFRLFNECMPQAALQMCVALTGSTEELDLDVDIVESRMKVIDFEADLHIQEERNNAMFEFAQRRYEYLENRCIVLQQAIEEKLISVVAGKTEKKMQLDKLQTKTGKKGRMTVSDKMLKAWEQKDPKRLADYKSYRSAIDKTLPKMSKKLKEELDEADKKYNAGYDQTKKGYKKYYKILKQHARLVADRQRQALEKSQESEESEEIEMTLDDPVAEHSGQESIEFESDVDDDELHIDEFD